MATPQERTAVVIEDDADVRNLLSAILKEAGFTCIPAATGMDGINAVREHRPILTTLDVSLPGIDGFEVARRIRGFSNTYVIMLSARDEEIDTLMGLDAGADDYLTKPFRPRELRARIEAMMRRRQTGWAGPRGAADGRLDGSPPSTSTPSTSTPSTSTPSTSTPSTSTPSTSGSSTSGSIPSRGPAMTDGWLSHNGLRINAEMWLCDLDGAPVELTRSEFDLLLALVLGSRRVITKDALALELRGDSFSGYVSDADRRAVEVHMANLRRKLNDSVSSPRYIETVRGVGYRLAEPRTR